MELLILFSSMLISIIFYILLPPLLDGIERKIKADIQSRYGPPTILQTWYDILKLVSKEVVIPMHPSYVIVSLSLLVTLTVFLAFMLSYIVSIMTITITYIALILVIIVSIHTLSLLMYMLSSNPFSIIGTFRAATIDLVNEVGLATFLILMFIMERIQSPGPIFLILLIIAFVSLMIAVFVSSRRLPYDLHEAEPEIASGSVIEFSGPILGLYVYNHLLERYLLTSVPVLLMLWVLKLQMNTVFLSLLLHLFTVVLYIVLAVVSAILGRSRIDLAVKTLVFLYALAIAVWLGVYTIGHII